MQQYFLPKFHRHAELRKGWTQQRVQGTKVYEETKQAKEAKWKAKVALMSKLRRKQKAQQAAIRQRAEALDAQIKVQGLPFLPENNYCSLWRSLFCCGIIR